MPFDRRLELPAEEVRALGYRVVDHIVEHLESLRQRDGPVAQMSSRSELERRFREPPPEEGHGWETAVERAVRDALGPMSHADHPRFFAYVPSPGNAVGAMADALAAAFNPFAGAWAMSSGAAQVGLVAVDWLRQLCGFPESAGGLFLSGGSMANLTALAVARDRRLGEDMTRGVLYCSDQAHSSIERAARTLGFRRDQVRKLTTGGDLRLESAAVEAAVDEDIAAGRIPFCVVATAGTTSTGAVDPLPALATLCRRRGLWLHVDGAYGAAAVLTERGRAVLDGVGEADSLSLDPHKWLFQPFECGCVLVRCGADLRDVFRTVPAYLRDSDLATEEINFRDWGIQLTRGFRALKLWMSLQAFGVAAFREAVGWGMHLAEVAERELQASGAWEVVTRAQLGIVTFRYRTRDGVDADDAQRRLATGLRDDGYAMLSTTELRGSTVLRLCTINPRTEEGEIAETILRLERIAAELGLG